MIVSVLQPRLLSGVVLLAILSLPPSRAFSASFSPPFDQAFGSSFNSHFYSDLTPNENQVAPYSLNGAKAPHTNLVQTDKSSECALILRRSMAGVSRTPAPQYNGFFNLFHNPKWVLSFKSRFTKTLNVRVCWGFRCRLSDFSLRLLSEDKTEF